MIHGYGAHLANIRQKTIIPGSKLLEGGASEVALYLD
jgi:hypothetical protein